MARRRVFFCCDCLKYRFNRKNCLLKKHMLIECESYRRTPPFAGKGLPCLLVTLLVVLMAFVRPIGSVKAQTPTNTPTPTPFQYSAQSAPFTILDYLYSESAYWVTPAHGLGLPDGQLATYDHVGTPDYYADFEMVNNYPAGYGAITDIKLDIIGKSFDNLVVYLTHGHSQLSSCNGKSVTGGSTIAHNYITFHLSTECSTMAAAYMYDHSFGIRLHYYYGAQNVTADIDAIGYLPIFASSPWGTGTTNSMQLFTPTGQVLLPLEACEAADWWCNMRNWLIGTINTIFGIDPSYANAKISTLLALTYSKVPWSYAQALLGINLTNPALATPSGVLPDFHINSMHIKVENVQLAQTTDYVLLPEATVSGVIYSTLVPAVTAIRNGLIVFMVGGWGIGMGFLVMEGLKS